MFNFVQPSFNDFSVTWARKQNSKSESTSTRIVKLDKTKLHEVPRSVYSERDI